MLALQLQEAPKIELLGGGLDDMRTAQIDSITFGTGQIAVNMERSKLSDYCTRVAILSSLSLTSDEIDEQFSKNYVSAQNAHARIFNRYGINTRAGIARCLFDSGVYEVETASEPLNLDSKQKLVATLISYGQTNNAIGEHFSKHYKTIGIWTKTMIEQAGLKDRTQISLAAIMSGEVGPFAAKALQKAQEKAHMQTTETPIV